MASQCHLWLRPVYAFLRAAVTKNPRLGGFKRQQSIISQLWSKDSEIKVPAGPAPSKTV